MSVRTKLLIVIVGVIAATAAGLYFAGVFGGGKEKAAVKYPMEPIALHEPFIINLADADQIKYVKMNIAVQLEPMVKHDRELFLGLAGGHGGHGGGEELGGPDRVAQYPKFRDAVIDVTSRYTSVELGTPKGKEQLKYDLLERFEQIAHQDELPKAAKKEEGSHDPSHPPYHVQDVFFQEFAVQ